MNFELYTVKYFFLNNNLLAFFLGTVQKDPKLCSHQFIGEFFKNNLNVSELLLRIYNFSLFEKIWITSDHTIFRTFLNLLAISTIFMVRELIEIGPLFRSIWKFVGNIHFSRRFRVLKFAAEKIWDFFYFHSILQSIKSDMS